MNKSGRAASEGLRIEISAKRRRMGNAARAFRPTRAEFHFTLDAAAAEWNHKCARYFSVADNSLERDWKGVVWLNPPYGRQMGDWIRKARDSADAGATVVCLVFARTDTAWWHDYVVDRAEIRFLRGRVFFVDRAGKTSLRTPSPSVVLVFRPRLAA